MFSMEITPEIAEIADEFASDKYPNQLARNAALLQEIAQLRGEVTTMALCEAPHLILRPDQTYRFVEMPGCEACAAAAAPFKTPNVKVTGE